MDAIKKIIKDFFQHKDQIISVHLFGSYAKGSSRKDSDVDVAILCDAKNMPSKLDVLQWRQDLADLLHKDVDLVCLNDASPILGMQVAQGKIDILVKNVNIYAYYIMYLFSDYAELKELRAPMEKDILKRKYYD